MNTSAVAFTFNGERYLKSEFSRSLVPFLVYFLLCSWIHPLYRPLFSTHTLTYPRPVTSSTTKRHRVPGAGWRLTTYLWFVHLHLSDYVCIPLASVSICRLGRLLRTSSTWLSYFGFMGTSPSPMRCLPRLCSIAWARPRFVFFVCLILFVCLFDFVCLFVCLYFNYLIVPASCLNLRFFLSALLLYTIYCVLSYPHDLTFYL